ncbi:MAG: hypothetical protein JZU70_03215 [Chlorobium sp.]|jgi:hypothetical protein|nr:hypothetical protein [Chlorobium sp.]
MQSGKSESRQNEFQKIGQAVPVPSFDATLNAPKMVQELAFQRCFMGDFSFEYLLILFNLKQKYMIAVLT